MTLRVLRYLIVGIVAFVIGLVAFLPARIAAGWIGETTAVSLGGVTGTVFAGHAAYASGPGGAIEDLDWALRPLRLLIGELRADIDVGSDLGGFSATASRSLFGGNRIDDLEGTASAGWLAKLGGYTFLPLSADVGIRIDEAIFDDALVFSALSGRVRLANTRWQLFNPPVELGRFNATVDRNDQGLRAAVVDSEGPLAIEGQIRIDRDRRYTLDVRLRARAGADERLEQMLDQLGGADAEGWHRVREQGRL